MGDVRVYVCILWVKGCWVIRVIVGYELMKWMGWGWGNGVCGGKGGLYYRGGFVVGWGGVEEIGEEEVGVVG